MDQHGAAHGVEHDGGRVDGAAVLDVEHAGRVGAPIRAGLALGRRDRGEAERVQNNAVDCLVLVGGERLGVIAISKTQVHDVVAVNGEREEIGAGNLIAIDHSRFHRS